MSAPFRILITSDAVGGVGIHSAQLARALRQRGHAVLVAVLGPQPPRPRAGAIALPFRLEWMSAGAAAPVIADTERAQAALAALARAWRADVIHSNQFAFAAGPPGPPRPPVLLAVHSDVVSWWHAVHGQPPPQDGFHGWYRALADRALQRAAVVVAPTRTVLEDLRHSFGFEGGQVINHGCAAPPPRAVAARTGAVWLGRVWDAAKQFHLLGQAQLPVPVLVAGEMRSPEGGRAALPPLPGVQFLGALPHAQVGALLARAAIYLGTSRYEPFGLAALEAAHAGCALLLNDIASFREVWGPAACYFARNDAADLARQLGRLARDGAARAALGAAAAARARQHFAPAPMAAAYETLYRGLV